MHSYSTPRTPRTVKRDQQRFNRGVLAFLVNCLGVAYIVLYVVCLWLNKWAVADLYNNPLVGFDLSVMKTMGATVTPKIVLDYQYWRLASSVFLNAGAIQLWFNISCVWTYGLFLTSALSWLEIVMVFVLSGGAGVTASANVAVDYVTSAASAPCVGLIGASCVLLVLRWNRFTKHWLSWPLIGLALGVQALMGATPFVDNTANIAGFCAGIFTAMACVLARSQVAPYACLECMLTSMACVVIAIPLAMVVLGIVGLNEGLPMGGCCNQVVCTDSPLWNCEASRIYPSRCSYSSFPNGSTLLTCPKDDYSYQVQANSSQFQLDQLCSLYCGLSKA